MTSAGSFRDVPGHSFCCPQELIGPFRVSAWKRFDDLVSESEELDGALIDVESLEAEHPEHIGPPRLRCGAIDSTDDTHQGDDNGGAHVQSAVYEADQVDVSVDLDGSVPGGQDRS